MINTYNKNILNEINIPVFSFENGQVVWANNQGKEILNIKDVMELKGKNIYKYLHNRQVDGKSLREIVSEVGAAFDGKTASSRISLALKIKGVRVEVLVKIVPIQSEYANSGIVILNKLQRKGDALLRRNTERFYADMFKQVSSPIIICDISNRVIEINSAFSDLFGYSREEAIDKFAYELVAPPEEVLSLMKINEMVLKGGVQNKALRLVDKWGRYIDVNFTGHPILENGEVIGTYRIYDDQKNECNLRKEIDLLKIYHEELFNISTEALVFLTKEDRVVYFNKAFGSLFGYSLNEAKGEFINNLIVLGDKMDEAKNISEDAMNLKPVTLKTTRHHKDGSPIPVELITNPIYKDGESLGVYAVYKDLTEQSEMKKELEIQSQYFNKLFKSSMDATVFLDINQNVLDINDAFADLFGYQVNECKGINIDELIVSKEYRLESSKLLNESLAEKLANKETKRMKKGGEIIDVETSGHTINVDGELIGILVNYRDISERKGILKALDEQKEYFKQLFDNSPEAIVIIDTNDRVIDVNKGFCKTFEYEKKETIGKYINDLIVPDGIMSEAEGLSAKVIGGGVVKYQTKRRSKTHRLIDVDILAYPIKLNNEHIGGYAIYSDITDKVRAEKEIEFFAYRDNLTGLFNRRVFYDKLEEKIKRMGNDEKLAVCYIDLNGFKKINDNMGHNIGDELLRYVAKNIEDSMDDVDVVARMGGDEFVIFTDIIDNEEVDTKMEYIIERMNKGLRIFDYSIKISLSIGVAIYPDHGRDMDEIIKKADTAMYRVKRDGRSGYRIYTNEMEKNDKYLYKVENGLKMALANSEIEMHYQPILSMDGTIKGFEALMRWESSLLGKVSPDLFIPIAENSGEIHQLGVYAFNQALKVLKKWQKSFGDNLFMSINISVKQIEKDDVVDIISEILNKHGITGKSIHLEITESCSTESVPNLREKLAKLKEMGFLITIDDFGTGYSSFGQLRDSYIDFIKINRIFVDQIDKKSDSTAIVKAIVALGKSINAKIIAEGIETERELEVMKQLGCDMYQGYLAKRPGSEESIEAYIINRK